MTSLRVSFFDVQIFKILDILTGFFSFTVDDEQLWNDRISRMDIKDTGCLNLVSIIIFGVIFLLGQTMLLVSWSLLWNRRRQSSLIENEHYLYGNNNSWTTRSSSSSQNSSSLGHLNGKGIFYPQDSSQTPPPRGHFMYS